MVTAAILAGGRARRLGGGDKSALVVGADRILDRQIAVLRAVAPHVLIVTRGPAPVAPRGLPVVQDLVVGAGALGGIYTALVAAPTPQVLVVACDMPFLSAPFLRHLAVMGRDVDVAIPRTADGYHPLCASFARACIEPVRRRIAAGALKVQDLLTECRVREIGPDEIAPFDPDGALFLNVNTPDDYARAVDLARQRA